MERFNSKVFITPQKRGFIIYVRDRFTDNNLAVTDEEMDEIVKLGALLLEDRKKQLKSTPKDTT